MYHKQAKIGPSPILEQVYREQLHRGFEIIFDHLLIRVVETRYEMVYLVDNTKNCI